MTTRHLDEALAGAGRLRFVLEMVQAALDEGRFTPAMAGDLVRFAQETTDAIRRGAAADARERPVPYRLTAAGERASLFS